jgi:hypothetical protein
MHRGSKCRFTTGRAEVTYPSICQNQRECSDACRVNYRTCQNNCGYNSLCLNGCTDVLNSCVMKAVPPVAKRD